jgi:hypothetical protein
MTISNKISRRRLLGKALGAATAGASAPCALFVPASAWGANDQIGVGVIGCGRRSTQH